MAFLVAVDVVSQAMAFVAAYLAAVPIKVLVLTGPSSIREWALTWSPELHLIQRPLGDVAWVLPVMAAVTIVCVQALGGYRPPMSQSRTRIVLASVVAPMIGLGVIAAIVFAFQSPRWSRLFIFLFTAFTALELAGTRFLLRWYRQKRLTSGFYARSVILVGSPRPLISLARHIGRVKSAAYYNVVGYVGIDSSPRQPITDDAQGDPLVLPYLGRVDQLATLLVSRPVHEVIAVHGGASDWVRDVVETCDYYRVTLRLVPDVLLFDRRSDLEVLYSSDELRLPEIVLRPRHLASTALFVKRVMDIVVSSASLLLLLPLFAVIAIAIKLTTPGLPVFYRWKVVGYQGRPFIGYKFSSMLEDADQRQGDLTNSNEMQGPVFKIRDDPRVTPLGRLLRKYSLNELPQLWSVLKGDMSLVGPRPAFPHELERYELWHKRKLSVRPGITCLWQVRGRNRISRFDDWVRMDLEYIERWSLWLDLRILARTAWTVLRGTGW